MSLTVPHRPAKGERDLFLCAGERDLDLDLVPRLCAGEGELDLDLFPRTTRDRVVEFFAFLIGTKELGALPLGGEFGRTGEIIAVFTLMIGILTITVNGHEGKSAYYGGQYLLHCERIIHDGGLGRCAWQTDKISVEPRTDYSGQCVILRLDSLVCVHNVLVHAHTDHWVLLRSLDQRFTVRPKLLDVDVREEMVPYPGRSQYYKTVTPATMIEFLAFFLIVLFTIGIVTSRSLTEDSDDGDYGRVEKDAVYCERSKGSYVKSRIGSKEGVVDCNASCGSSPFRHVYVTDDVFINGERVKYNGNYCIGPETSVVRCNTATSKLVLGGNSLWACEPRWPELFGGADGGDILACGGKLRDGTNYYENRLPASRYLEPITNPYAEEARFECTPGEYTDGPRDHMNNRYRKLHENRFQRTRNDCAKYVANATELIVPVAGQKRHCNCLPIHGPLRRLTYDQRHPSRNKRVKRLVVPDTSSGKREDVTVDVFQVPHACSPCVASGHLVKTDGVFNFPVECVKSNQRFFETDEMRDLLPCGGAGFTSASQPSCENVWLYVSDGYMSPILKKAIRGLTT